MIPSSFSSDDFDEPIEYPSPVLTIVGCEFADDEKETRVWGAIDAVERLEQTMGPFDGIDVVVPSDSNAP